MNDVCTISPSDSVGLPAKVIWSTAFFLKKKTFFCTTFESAIGRLAWDLAHGWLHAY